MWFWVTFIVILLWTWMNLTTTTASIIYWVSYQSKIGDYNMDLLSYDQHSLTNEFLTPFLYLLLPPIVQATRMRINFKTLTDDIYSNVNTLNNISGKITATISDHFPQIFVSPDIFSNPSSTKLNIFERYCSKFDQENFILGYLSVDWEYLIKSNNENVDQSFVSFLTKFNSILDFYDPLKKIPKKN